VEDDRARPSAAGAWREALSDRGFLLRLAAAVPALVVVLAALARFLEAVESRPGVVLPDPLLALLPPRDLTWPTFALIYGGLFAALAWLLPRPRRLLLGVQAYVLLVLFRIAAMWALPLGPPEGLIPLDDPLVRLFGPSRVLTKDLFFSGHTATLFLLGLAATAPRLRALLLAATAAVGACVLVQHVHYAIDVLAAPFFAWGSWCLAERIGAGGRAAGSPSPG
jgi:hypothetical protein